MDALASFTPAPQSAASAPQGKDAAAPGLAGAGNADAAASNGAAVNELSFRETLAIEFGTIAVQAPRASAEQASDDADTATVEQIAPAVDVDGTLAALALLTPTPPATAAVTTSSLLPHTTLAATSQEGRPNATDLTAAKQDHGQSRRDTLAAPELRPTDSKTSLAASAAASIEQAPADSARGAHGASAEHGFAALLAGAATLPATAAPINAPPVQHAEIAAPVQSPVWREHVGDTVTWMVSENIQHAEITLNPPDLGPVSVHVALDGDHRDQATVQFVASQAATREALETALPRLREMLADAGITLTDASVNSQSRHAGEPPGGGERAPRTARVANAGTASGSVVTTALPARAASRLLVDTFA